ncbi:MAG: DUF1156 domain-containing protein [Limnobacter sp.]|uniref:DUF1156 domain-containing protein n=1 Tax=Limnobacter sp. TaxID=2003368 RepID=UPI00391D42DE
MHLIDHGFLDHEASRAGARERHARGETVHTLQVWWARRPHNAMRALCLAALLARDEHRVTDDLLREALDEAVPSPELLARCQALLLLQYDGQRPKVLDMFSGSGTLPLEAANLGCDTTAIDVNELSAFILRVHLEWVPKVGVGPLKALVKQSGERVLERLAQATDALFPLRHRMTAPNVRQGPVTYLWTYQTRCDCGHTYHLSKRRELSVKAGRYTRLDPVQQPDRQGWTIAHEKPARTARVSKFKPFVCPACGLEQPKADVRQCTDTVVAVVRKQFPRGKLFDVAPLEAAPSEETLQQFVHARLKETGLALPTTPLPAWTGVVNLPRYGLTQHAQWLNTRQTAVMLCLIQALSQEHQQLLKDHGLDVALAVTGVLSGLVDQLLDWNCRLSVWMPQNEQVGRALCGPGLPMVWDYAETDPVLPGPSNLHSKLRRIIKGLDALGQQQGPVHVACASAENLPLPDHSFDAIVTDPPYYDNLVYSMLADCIYAWKRLLLGPLVPDLFGPVATAGEGAGELVAFAQRHEGNARQAHEHYSQRLTTALCEAARVLKPGAPLVWVYAHAQARGWAALLTAFRQSPMWLTGAHGLGIERRSRPRAVLSEAVNTCVAFVGRAQPGQHRPALNWGQTQQALRSAQVQTKATRLQALGWSPADAAWVYFAQGIVLLANQQAHGELADEDLIGWLVTEVQRLFPEFSLGVRKML